MNYYNKSGQMDLTDRVAIETGLCRGESFKKIAKRIRRHPTTVAHEVFENRTYIKGTYFAGKDCRHVRTCAVKNLCDGSEDACNYRCKHCRGYDCTKMCKRYESVACHKPDKPPYVCNTCKDRKLCIKDKYVYSAPYADAAVSRRRSESRQGIHLTEEQKVFVDELVTRLVKKDQHISCGFLRRLMNSRELIQIARQYEEDADFDDFFCDCEGKHITQSRANEIKTTLNLIWEYGKSQGLVETNHSKEFRLTDYDFIPRKVKPLKNSEERNKLIEYYISLDTVYGYACALMECLNMRISEIKALKWADIFLDDGYILVSHMVDNTGIYREYTKNHATEGSHFVQLSPRAINILRIVESKEYDFKDGFVFLGKNDNYLLTGECNKNIQRACKALGFKKNFTTHDCRRYAATQAALAGMSSPALQKAFGWKDRDTAEKYIQIAAATKEHQKVLVDVLN